MIPCPFCQRLPSAEVISRFSVAFKDHYPVSDGHTLVVPRRCVASMSELTEEERLDMWKLVDSVIRNYKNYSGIDGWNVGFNDGAAAGQTVQHAHIHVIPRKFGDVVDPRGGVRWVIPEKAAYWLDRSSAR